MTADLRYLLDTNVLSALVKNNEMRVTERVMAVGEQQICTSIIAASELRYGALKSKSEVVQNRVSELLASISVLPWEAPADRCYAVLRHELSERGEMIGPNDLLIAAHAMSLALVVVTANVREFSRIPHLTVENWLDVSATD